jgi:hypothetical protein
MKPMHNARNSWHSPGADTMRPEHAWAAERERLCDGETACGPTIDTASLLRRAEKILAESEEVIAQTQRVLAEVARTRPGLVRPRKDLPRGYRARA